MRLATATSVFYQYTIQDAIDAIAKLGYEGVDIWGGRPHVYRNDLSAAELRDLRNRIEDQGLSVSSFMPAFYRYPHSLSNPNPKVRDDSVDYMRECIDNAAMLEAGIVLIVPDLTLYEHDREDSLQRLVECIDRIAQYASPYNLELGIEVLFYDETDLVTSADDAINIINQLGYENLCVVLDTGTLNLSKEQPEDIFSKLNNLVKQIHVNDNDGNKMQQNLIPGDGTYDFKSLIQFLNTIDYTGFLSAELSKHYADDPEPALRTTADRLREWMQKA